MRFLKYFLVFAIILAAAGIGVYYVGTNIASDKIVEEATSELAESGKMDEIKTYVEKDPQLSGYIEEAKEAEGRDLPIKTKGEATRVLIQKVGISELKTMQSEVKKGTMTQQEAIQKLETQLSEEEMLALKVLAYKELYKQQ
ncbi:hypothetical protein BN1080_01455 [Planococcus massiliensis]|uniref:Phenylalanyl-tRNA synthetase subunit beta n=1 Tax=Planococcus massiliensis TaxID=1499687 RepID=A0A098EMJ7_9BACL|nr:MULTISPECIES: hypothetical protein [Planococcus]MCJ1907292.1 hypothetical protein [Planococcus ruber]CEG22526.1 hypothetical protein BN1080_01455 [Planococcus massiliensis]